MKRLMMYLAMLAMVLAVAVPAIANTNNHDNHNNNHDNHNGNNNNGGETSVIQPIGQESQSGNVTPSFTATQSGNDSNQCIVPLQFGNSGSLQNGQGVLDFNNNNKGNNNGHVPLISFGGIDQQGSLISFGPTLTVNCDQQVQQSAAASSQDSPQYSSQYSG